MVHPGVLLFGAAVFLNALLLFLVEPMFAKLLLPLFGGSPAVWTTCMLFFQSALLAAYGYSHWLAKLRDAGRQTLIHIVLITLAMLTLPFAVIGPSTIQEPVVSVLSVATMSVGATFFILATSAPLLQRWFASAHARPGSDPYFLYAASNTGSLAALVAYPIIIEPALALSKQATIWSFGYRAAAVLTVLCALVMWRTRKVAPSSTDAEADPPPEAITVRRRVRWIALAFVPSSLMLAVTAYLSTDVAAVPLLWIAPLALYLVSFIVTFSRHADRAIAMCSRAFPLTLLVLIWLLISEARLPLAPMLGAHLVAFLVLAVLCHGALAVDRPSAAHLTDFYLSLALGGAIGGVFNTLLAPLLFKSVMEYPIVVAVGVLLVPRVSGEHRTLRLQRWVPIAAGVLTIAALKWPGTDSFLSGTALGLLTAAVVVSLSVSRDSRRFAAAVGLMLLLYIVLGGRGSMNVVHASRTFFGTYRVVLDPGHRFFTLFHGTTIHGRQGLSSDEPLTYYHRQSPIAQVLTTRPAAIRSIGVVGLGTGTLAAYAQPEQHWTFYEIDPEVERLARDARYFRYLSRCGSQCDVVIGDARQSLQQRSQMHDLIVLDAFSSDAIPIHLLTREAIAVYLKHLNPDGVLAFHISNNHLNLRPVIAGFMREYHLEGRAQFQPNPKDEMSGCYGSHWAVLARSTAALGSLATDKHWQALVPRADGVWTDDFSNIWSVIQWRQ